jgi:uncharacterized protein YtpQ (UPF0354 family)
MKFHERILGIFRPRQAPDTNADSGVAKIFDHIDIRSAIAHLKVLVPSSGEQPADDNSRLVTTPFISDLVVTYVVDNGETLQFVQGKHLQAAGIDRAELHRIGLQNLFVKMAHGNFAVHDVGPFHGVTLEGHFEASLMLVDDLWNKVLFKLTPNGACVAVPARDLLIFCDRKNHTALKDFDALVRGFGGRAHRLTSTLFERDHSAKVWKVFEG